MDYNRVPIKRIMFHTIFSLHKIRTMRQVRIVENVELTIFLLKLVLLEYIPSLALVPVLFLLHPHSAFTN